MRCCLKRYQYIRKTMTHCGRRYEVRGKTEAEAQEKLNELKERLRRGDWFPGGTATVDQWYRKWMKIYKNPAGLTPKSLCQYGEKYDRYIRPAVGRLPLLEVRDFHLQEILNGQAGMSYSHVSKLRMVMQELFRQAFRSRLIPFDPAAGLTLPDHVRRSRRPVTGEERAAILAVAEDHPDGLLMLTLLYAGLRPGEAAALQWQDVDFAANELHIARALESGSNELRPPKTPAGVRDVPIHRALRDRLWQARGGPEEPVFRNRRGNRHNHSSLYRAWGSFARAMDLYLGAVTENGVITEHRLDPGLTPYCLRHTFCTDLQRAGVPLNVAKELMGHADITVTANIYTHRDTEVLHSGMSRLEKSSADE